MHVGRVILQVSDLRRSLLFYEDVIGFARLDELTVAGRPAARLGAHGSDGTALLELREKPGVRAVPRRGLLGLYHFALRLPDRPSLAMFVRHLRHSGTPAAAADHGFSEALYLVDPEVARQAHAAGTGRTITATLGGKSDPVQGPPVTLDAEVVAVSDGRFVYDGPMYAGLAGDLGPSAWLRSGGVNVVVVSGRMQPLDQSFARSLGIDCAAMRYIAAGTPLIILTGKEYGTGSSRDWAAKGPALLGVRAVIAESYERIHRSNLVGMGVLPLAYEPGSDRKSLGLTGAETFTITGIASGLAPGGRVTVKATAEDGRVTTFPAVVRLNSPVELEYYRHGGILQRVLRQFLKGGVSV